MLVTSKFEEQPDERPDELPVQPVKYETGSDDPVRVNELSDKHLQKLCKLTQLQLELCRQTCDDLDKSC